MSREDERTITVPNKGAIMPELNINITANIKINISPHLKKIHPIGLVFFPKTFVGNNWIFLKKIIDIRGHNGLVVSEESIEANFSIYHAPNFNTSGIDVGGGTPSGVKPNTSVKNWIYMYIKC